MGDAARGEARAHAGRKFGLALACVTRILLLLSLAFIPFYNPASHGLHPLYKLGWTLNYEMFFYVSFALLAVLRARQRVMVLTMAYLTLSLTGLLLHPESPIPAFYTSYMPLAFVAGAWLGLAHIEGRLLNMPRSMIVPLLAIALLSPTFLRPNALPVLIVVLTFTAVTVLFAAKVGRLSERQFAVLGFGGMTGVAISAYLVADPSGTRAVTSMLAIVPAIAASSSPPRVTARLSAASVVMVTALSVVSSLLRAFRIGPAAKVGGASCD